MAENKVSLQSLQEIAKQLIAESEAISEIYNSKVKAAFVEADGAFKVANIDDLSQLEATTSQAFDALNKNIQGLANILNTKIVANWDQAIAEINQLFNSTFKQEFEQHIADMKACITQ